MSTPSSSRSRRPLWLVEGLDIAEQRRLVIVVVTLALAAVGVVVSLLAPGVVPRTAGVGAAVGFASLLLGYAAAVAVDAADLTVRGPRHVRAAGAELVAIVPARPTPDDAAPLAEAVLDAREGEERILLGLAATGRDAAAVATWTDELGRALARSGVSVLVADLASGRTDEPGLHEVLDDGARIGAVAEIDDELLLARIGAGRDLRAALTGLAQLPSRLPRDLDVLLVALPTAASREVVAAAATLDHLLLTVERDATARVDLIAALDALERAQVPTQAMLVDDVTVARLVGPDVAAGAGGAGWSAASPPAGEAVGRGQDDGSDAARDGGDAVEVPEQAEAAERAGAHGRAAGLEPADTPGRAEVIQQDDDPAETTREQPSVTSGDLGARGAHAPDEPGDVDQTMAIDPAGTRSAEPDPRGDGGSPDEARWPQTTDASASPPPPVAGAGPGAFGERGVRIVPPPEPRSAPQTPDDHDEPPAGADESTGAAEAEHADHGAAPDLDPAGPAAARDHSAEDDRLVTGRDTEVLRAAGAERAREILEHRPRIDDPPGRGAAESAESAESGAEESGDDEPHDAVGPLTSAAPDPLAARPSDVVPDLSADTDEIPARPPSEPEDAARGAGVDAPASRPSGGESAGAPADAEVTGQLRPWARPSAHASTSAPAHEPEMRTREASPTEESAPFDAGPTEESAPLDAGPTENGPSEPTAVDPEEADVEGDDALHTTAQLAILVDEIQDRDERP